jgi:Ca2+-binding EF-hand superfamily protein
MSSISSISSGGSYQPDFTKLSQRIFQQADCDSDGKISQDELLNLMKANPKLASDLTQYYNASASGATTASDNVTAIFQSLDTDGDGAISLSELGTAVTNTKGGQVGGPPSPPPPPELASDAVFASADTDDDGSWSESEFEALLDNDSRLASAFTSLLDRSSAASSASTTAATADPASASGTVDAKAIFQALDTDGDGSVSASELSTAFSKVRDSLNSGNPPPPDALGGATDGTDQDATAVSARLDGMLMRFLLSAQHRNGYSADGSSSGSSASSSFRASA